MIKQRDGLNVPVRIVNTNDDAVTLGQGTNLYPLREVKAIKEHVPIVQQQVKKKPATSAEHIKRL